MTIVRRWSQVEKDPNYWPTLVKRNAARLFISEADLSANKTRSQRGKCSISFKSQRVRVFTAGTWTRCTDYSLLSISLLQPHSFRIRPFRFPSLSLGICLVALSLFSMPAWQSIRTSFPLFSSVLDLGPLHSFAYFAGFQFCRQTCQHLGSPAKSCLCLEK